MQKYQGNRVKPSLQLQASLLVSLRNLIADQINRDVCLQASLSAILICDGIFQSTTFLFQILGKEIGRY